MINYHFFKKAVVLSFFCSVLFFCKDIEIEKKIDANLRLQLKNQKVASQLDQKLTIIFKVNEEITGLHRQVLSRIDVKIIANIGHIYTASIPARNIIDLARMKFVTYIQSSKEFKMSPGDSIKQIIKL